MVIVATFAVVITTIATTALPTLTAIGIGGGEISAAVAVEIAPRMLRIIIDDDGPGIPPERRARRR
jgi:signal transduction histidine kinase